MKKSFLCFIILSQLGCKDLTNVVPVENPQGTPVQTPADVVITGYKSELNIAYGSEQLQNLDVYLPNLLSGKQASIALIMIHGGGWKEGDKGYINPLVETLKAQKKNIAIFNINHRLTFMQGVKLNEQLADIGAVISFINSNKAKYNLSGSIVLMGYSSGGHLALVYAYKNTSNSNIKAVVGLVAPTDLSMPDIQKNIVDKNGENLIELLIGVPYNQKPEAYTQASPYYIVTKNAQPTLLLYGDADQTVNYSQGEKLFKKLNTLNVKTSFKKYSQGTHELSNMNDIFEQTIVFLKANTVN
jgi:acetyl esterase/lipase